MNGVPFTKTQVNIAATNDSNPPSSNNQVKKKRKKKLQVSKASTAPALPQTTTYPQCEPFQNYHGRGRGGRGGRGNSQRGRGAPKRSDFQNYNERNSWQQKPTCLKCGSSRQGHTASNCYSHVWCNNCRTDNHGPRACQWL